MYTELPNLVSKMVAALLQVPNTTKKSTLKSFIFFSENCYIEI